LSGDAIPVERVAAYARFYETMTLEKLSELAVFCAPGVLFRDPFNETRGVPALRRVFEHMFAVLDDPVFSVTDIAVSGEVAYFKWTFTARSKDRWKLAITLTGVSEVIYDKAGLVTTHLDHWDAASQVYGQLPLIGGLFRWLSRRLAVPDQRLSNRNED
jgi:steroid delta-isomerase